ncbi:hypothetical protein [Spirosoma daeguense]
MSLLLAQVIIVLLFIHGCKPPDNIPDILNSDGCRLTSRSTAYAVGKKISNWTYTKTGELLNYSSTDGPGGSPQLVNFIYDANGYLISTIQIRNFNDMSYDTLITKYEYRNGKLSSESNRSWTTKYEYNQLNELAKVTKIYTFANTEIYSFSANKLTDYVWIDGNSKEENRPFEIKNGLIYRHHERNRQHYINFQYDAQERPIKVERFSINNPSATEYYIFEYTNGKAYFDALPTPKGWPAFTRKSFIYDVYVLGTPLLPETSPVLPVSALFINWNYYAGTSPTFKQGVMEFEYVKNRQGYSIKTDRAYTQYTATGQIGQAPAHVIESYTYENCP